MRTFVELRIDDPDLLIGLVEAEGIRVGESSDDLRREMEELVRRRRGEEFPPPERKRAIRNMLRRGGFRPAGRNKPASEYLAGRAAADDFPFHANVVDIGNHISLFTGLPVSVLDADRSLGEASGLEIRLGRAKESYVFNPAGQEIDLTGLVCVARAGGPALGNPVKDSMDAKVVPGTTRVIAAVYADRTTADREELREILGRFAAMLERHAGAEGTAAAILANE
ncbi:MAG: hypothetical protein JW958_00875 [Candidatus Eisenbacteria bacterium]|nr:hypothetical protein [Candidatus Eisenbacteria bacterium]